MARELSKASASPDDLKDTYLKSSGLFNAVSETDPELEFEKHGFKTLEAVLGRVATDQHWYYEDLVRYGYDDIRSALDRPLAEIDRDLKSQLEFAHHEKTIQALGSLANRSEPAMHGLIENYGAVYGARLAISNDTDQKPYLRLIGDEYEPKSDVRCPFAAMREGIMPAKPYEKFTHWAGEVIVRAEHLQRRNNLSKQAELGLSRSSISLQR